jgi:hypothetical protein
MRLIDADALIDAINKWMPNQEEFMESAIPPIENLAVSVLLTIEEQPTIDAVPAIRCENCQFFLENWKCMTWHMFVRPDGHCFRAKRKPDADESV